MLDDILNDDWSVVDDGLEELDVSILRDTHPFELRSQHRDYQPEQRHLLFVYGSMKRGYPNHDRIMGRPNNKFMDTARTTEGRYLMGSRTSGNKIVVPMAARDSGGHFNITGEAYIVDGPTLFNIDLAEGTPDIYIRRNVRIIVSDGYTYLANMYLFVNEFDNHLDYPNVITDGSAFRPHENQTFRCKEYER